LSGTEILVVTGNSCSSNGLSGIVAREDTSVIMENNIADKNQEAGILLKDNSSGTVSNNQCTENRWGIYLEDNASPVLENNTLQNNNDSNLEDGLYRPISMSIGHAVVNEGELLEEGYKKADAAMYREKSSKKTDLS
jgi:parallel beta-helix repeat protein